MNPLPKRILDFLIADAKKWKRNVIVFVIVCALAFFYSYTKESSTSSSQELYNGGDFTMVVPVGSTPVKVKNSTKPVGEQQMVWNIYSFLNGSVSYQVQTFEYSNHAVATSEEALRVIPSQLFNAGYSATFSNSHLGALPAAAAEVEGTTLKGKQAFVRTRMTISDDRKHAWMAIIVAPDRQTFPAAQAEEFMDKIQIATGLR